MKRPPNTSRREHWLTIVTIAVFAMAVAGAGFALHILLPPLLNGPDVKSSLVRFALLLVSAFFIVAFAARLRRR